MDKIKKVKNRTKHYAEKPAMNHVKKIDFENIFNTMNDLSDTQVIFGGAKKESYQVTSKKNNDNINNVVYERLNKMNFFEEIAEPKQSGAKLYNKVIKYDKTQNIMANKSNKIGNLTNYEDASSNIKKLNNILKSKGTVTVFDLEGLSGINKAGHATYNYITELAAIQFNVDKGQAAIGSELNTVLGFSKEEARDIRQRLKKMEAKGKAKWSNEEKVLYERLNIYGHSKANQNGFNFKIYEAKGIEDIKQSYNTAEKGLQFLEDIGEKQTKWMKENGINKPYAEYRKDKIIEFKNMLKASDIVQGHNISSYDITSLNVLSGDNTPLNNVYDTYQIAVRSMQEFGVDSIYSKESSRKGINLGRGTQGAIAKAHGLNNDSVASHIAEYDLLENALFTFGEINGNNKFDKNGKIKIADKSYFNEVVMKNMKKLDGIYDKTSTKYTGANQLYLMDHTVQKSYNNHSRSLSFEYDPIRKGFKTLDGFEIKDGKVSNEKFSAFGPKKDAVYSHEIFEFEMNDNFKNMFSNVVEAGEDEANQIFQQFKNAKNLYVTKSTPYYNEKDLTLKLGSKEAAKMYIENAPVTYSFETDRNRLGANLGINIGEVVNGEVVANEKSLKALNYSIYSQKKKGNGKGFVKNEIDDTNVLFKKVLDKSYDRTINDSAARKMRNFDYITVMNYRNYQKALEAQGYDNNAPIIQRISKLISEGKDIDLTKNEEIINALGWHDFDNKKNKIVKETIKNSMVIDPHIKRMSPLLDEIINKVDDMYGSLDTSDATKRAKLITDPITKEQIWKKNFAFRHIYENTLEAISNSPEVSNMWMSTIHSEKDMNKIDFYLDQISPKAARKQKVDYSRDYTKKIVSVNLESNNSLLDTFYNTLYGDLDAKGLVSKETNAGYHSLYEAYTMIRADKRFKKNDGTKIFDDIDIHDRDKSVATLNDEMMDELRRFRKNKITPNAKGEIENKHFGLLFGRLNSDIITPNAIEDYLSNTSQDDIKRIVDAAAKTVPKDFKMVTNPASTEGAINDLVNNYFLGFSLDDLNKSMKEQGFTNDQMKIMRKQYDLAKKASTHKAEDLVNAISHRNINYFIKDTDNGPVLSLVQGDRIEELESLFRFKNNKGMISYTLGDNEYALRMGISRSKEGAFGFTNNVDKIVQVNQSARHATWAAKNGDPVLDAIIQNEKNTSASLRKSASRIEVNNGQTHAFGFQFDLNESMWSLPDLLEDGTLTDLEARYNIDDKAKESIRSIINRIAPLDKTTGKRRKDYNYRRNTFEKILPVELNFYTENYFYPIKDLILNSEDLTQEEKDIFKTVEIKSKREALSKGHASVGENYFVDPLADFDNTARPTVNQMQNTMLYNKEKVESEVADLIGKDSEIYKHLNSKAIYTSSNMERLMYNNISSANEAATSGLTMKYMQIDAYTLRDQFLDDNNIKKLEGFLDKNVKAEDLQRAKEVIRNRTKSFTTYEQESLMDARIHDIAFNKTYTQTISAKKKVVSSHRANVEVIEYIKSGQNKLHFTIDENGKIKYDLGVKVAKNQELGMFGNEDFLQSVTARHDGVFRARYFDDHGNVLSESKIEDFIKEYKLDINDHDKIHDALSSKFKFKYQVLGAEEMHGSKVFIGSAEKTTIDSMKLKVGEIDKDLRKELVDLGHGDIVDRVISKEYMDEYLHKDIVNKKGVEVADNIIDRIKKERYLLSDAVHSIDAFKDVNFITALNMEGHNALTPFMQKGLNQLKEDGNLNEKNLDTLFGKDNYTLIKDQDGKGVQVKFDKAVKELSFEDILNNKNEDLIKAFNKDTSVIGKVRGADTPGTIGTTGVVHIAQVFDDPAGTTSGVFDNKVVGKGVKFTSQMGANLDRQTYNIDGIQRVYDSMKNSGDFDMFFDSFGHALDIENFENGKIAFNQDYAGKSIAAPITNRLRSQLIKSDFEKTVADVMDDDKYSHIVKFIGKGREDVTVDKAEQMYSYAVGQKAMALNYKGSEGLVESMTNADDHMAFKLVDWTKDNPEWLDLDIGGQAKTITHSAMNPYTNNMIIKTGLGGAEEYIAFGRMPEKYAGDSIQKSEYQKLFIGLQEKFKSYNNGQIEKGVLVDHIHRLKDSVATVVGGKDQIQKSLTEFRMNQSLIGKASGIVMSAFDENNNKLIGSGNVDILDKMNPEIFKNAKFKGQSLNEHYAKGRVVDSVFMSEQAFRDMGYFDEKFLNNTFGDNFEKLNKDLADQFIKDGISQEDAMKHLLRTQGDSFVTVRYPEIQQGSDKFAMGYLKDDLKANEVQVVGPTGMSAKLDFDGDNFAAARIALQDGRSSLHANIQKEVGDELGNLNKSFEANILTRATTDNAYWENQMMDFLTGKKGNALTVKSLNIEDIAKGRLINGKMYADGIADRSEDELRSLFDQYKTVIGKHSEYDGEGLINAINEVGGEAGIANDKNLHDYVAAKAWQERRDTMVAKIYHNAIGETNVTNQDIKKIFQGYLKANDDAYEYKSNLIYDFLYQAEEQAISSKKSIEGLEPDRAQQWNKPISELMTGKGDKLENLKQAQSWLERHVTEDLIPEHYYAKSDFFASKMNEKYGVASLEQFTDLIKSDKQISSEIRSGLIDDIMTMVKDVSDFDGSEKMYKSLKNASSNSQGFHRRMQDRLFFKEQDSNMKYVLQAFEKHTGINMMSEVSNENLVSSKEFRQGIDELMSDATENIGKVSTEEKIGDIINGIGKITKSASGKKLAMGAVGVAAGIMVAGFVGGRPRPADVHAMEEASDYQTPMEGHSLADPSLAMNTSQQGYVININARTNKGRDHAVQALQEAISSGAGGNINVSMNIEDKYGNIRDRDIENAILGAL